MNVTKTLGLASLSATLLFTACKKDDESGSNATPGCKVNRALLYSGGSSVALDTSTYTYTGDKLSKITGGGEETSFEYSGDKITKINYLSAGTTTPDEVDQISYNSDGSISKIEYLDRVSGSSFQAYYRYEFTYTSGKLSKLTEYEVTNGVPEKTWEYIYTYTGNNITKVDETDYTLTPAETASYSFSYDSNNNYYKKQNIQALLTDPYFGGADGVFLPVFYSDNNVTSIGSGPGALPISYTTDDKQNLKDVVLATPNAQFRVSYDYLCQ